MSTVFVVVAGNIVDDFNEDAPNAVEVFTTQEGAEAFGALYDYYTVTEKKLDPTVQMQ